MKNIEIPDYEPDADVITSRLPKIRELENDINLFARRRNETAEEIAGLIAVASTNKAPLPNRYTYLTKLIQIIDANLQKSMEERQRIITELRPFIERNQEYKYLLGTLPDNSPIN